VDDVITEVNHQTVKSASDVSAALQRSGSRPALLLVNRNGRSLFLAVQPR
jgi:S1-C subfamily serine protease